MRILKTFKILLVILLILSVGCEDITEREKFQRPDWLPGKLYTTVSSQEYLTQFSECLRLSGLDSILDVSGSWAVFAPTDGAVERFLVENQYASLEDIPVEELRIIVKSHILQNPWTLDQLQGIDQNGWRSNDNGNWRSYAFKFQTIFKNSNEKYWIKRNNNVDRIVMDSTIANDFRIVYTGSRKYAPVFYDEYVDANGISSEDFSFYFGRAYEPGSVYFAGGKILKADIFAENGFVHIIDRVVEPMLNAKELLERETPGESYKLFLEMIYWYYPTFEPNIAATNDQAAVRIGGDIDTLFDLHYGGFLQDTYDDLAFDIHSENVEVQNWYYSYDYTLVRHNGIIAPTDDAFRDFIDGLLTANSGYPHWSDYRSLPWDIVQLIFPRHFMSSPVYPSSYEYYTFFYNDDRFLQNEGDIIRNVFGSNCTFIGLSSYNPDKVFTSVTGPVFCRPKFSWFRLALQYSGTDDILATDDGELCFFPISDYALDLDSSMTLTWQDIDYYQYNFREYNRLNMAWEDLSGGAIRSRILNHVGTSLPDGSANKEFIPTMGGNYIIWNNSDNTVRGSLPSTIGFNGDVEVSNTANRMAGRSDNGEVYSVDYWFNFDNKSMQTILWRYSKFFSLLTKAGIENLSFIDSWENYTVFVPSNDALESYQADTLSMADLGDFLKYHFVRGAMIFTDNKQASDYYSTSSGAMLNIRTSPDVIEILDNNGDTYLFIPEQENSTNIMVSDRSEVTSVVHEIDKVLINN
ncbi:fasciclin domain-containing protein [Bacteroidota bacterium]